jgi:hypothetical protein
VTATKEKAPDKIAAWEKPIEFTETFKWDDLDATFKAESYNKWMLDALPMIGEMPILEHTEAREKGIKVGDRIFYKRRLPMYSLQMRWMFGHSTMNRTGLAVYKGRTERTARFDAEIGIPVLADKSLAPWMSLTPNEVFTLRGQIRRAKGHVAMAGLGMGWAARKVLERKQVRTLTVFEKDQDVIDFFGKSLTDDFGARVVIHRDDAYQVNWMQYDVALWDIWKGIGDAAWDDKYNVIKSSMIAAGKVCVGWTDGNVYRG